MANGLRKIIKSESGECHKAPQEPRCTSGEKVLSSTVNQYCVDSMTGEFGEVCEGCEGDPLYVLAHDYDQLQNELDLWDNSFAEANKEIERLEMENKKLRADMVRMKTMLQAVRGEVEQLLYDKEQSEQAATNKN